MQESRRTLRFSRELRTLMRVIIVGCGLSTLLTKKLKMNSKMSNLFSK